MLPNELYDFCCSYFRAFTRSRLQFIWNIWFNTGLFIAKVGHDCEKVSLCAARWTDATWVHRRIAKHVKRIPLLLWIHKPRNSVCCFSVLLVLASKSMCEHAGASVPGTQLFYPGRKLICNEIVDIIISFTLIRLKNTIVRRLFG